MKRVLIILLVGVFLLGTVSSLDLDVEVLGESPVLIDGLEKPISFVLNITNNGEEESFKFYTLFGLGFQDIGRVNFFEDETKIINLTFIPRDDFDYSGKTSFGYFIQDESKEEIEKKLSINFIELSEAFELQSEEINTDSMSVEFKLKNIFKMSFDDVEVSFFSIFFEMTEVASFGELEEKTFKVELDPGTYNEIAAGFYNVDVDLKYENISSKLVGLVEFVSEEKIVVETDSYGLIVKTNVIKKTNEGNVEATVRTLVHKSFFSRIFTSFSVEPSIVEGVGLGVDYIWDSSLAPGESITIKVKTNWFIPIIILILVVAIFIFIRRYSESDLLIRKNVSFVHARGGEFALKVILNITAKKDIDELRISDKLPPLVKVYGRFGGETPKRFYKSKKTFEWELGSLFEGQRKTLSYIIYSKVGIMGRFALPATRASYKSEGKEKSTTSNKSFFLSEPKEE